jgi:Aldehyde dehydrogenase family
VFNSGQACISVERVYVEAPAYDRFVALLTERVLSIRQGVDNGSYSADVGTLVTAQQVEIVRSHVQDAVAHGATIATGGKTTGNGGLFEPTILLDVDHSMACMRDETFGPTIPVMKVADEEEAIRLANDSQYGLSSRGTGGAPGQLIAIGHETRAWKDHGRFEIGIDQHSNPVAVSGQHLNATVPKLNDRRPDLAGSHRALSAAFANNPDQRFSSCGDFAKGMREQVAAAPLGEHTTQAAAAAAAPGAAPIFAGAQLGAGRRPPMSVLHIFVSALVAVPLMGAVSTLAMLFGGSRESRRAARSIGRRGPSWRQRSRQRYMATTGKPASSETQ